MSEELLTSKKVQLNHEGFYLYLSVYKKTSGKLTQACATRRNA